eukprot:54229-Chlamydomonas_euryale.AAC.6
MSLVGSAPGDSRQMSGHLLCDSLHARSMLSGTDSTNRCPSASLMYSAAAMSVRSSRNVLTTTCKGGRKVEKWRKGRGQGVLQG